jgi:hypothetical protein
MTAFHKKPFAARLATMGDTAEDIFDHVNGGRCHALGLNRVWVNGEKLYMNNMTAAMRYTPDRMTSTSYVECMGIGRDGTLKIKSEKIAALLRWCKIGPTELFVYDQSDHVYYQAPINQWQAAIHDHGVTKSFPEGKEYSALHKKHFPVAPEVIEGALHAVA